MHQKIPEISKRVEKKYWHHRDTNVLQETFHITAMTLIENPESTTIEHLVLDIIASSNELQNASPIDDGDARSMWIAPSPVSVKMRLFCFPYAGGISENVFARQAPSYPLVHTSSIAVHRDKNALPSV